MITPLHTGDVVDGIVCPSQRARHSAAGRGRVVERQPLREAHAGPAAPG
jgi:hypothetical protein